MVSIGENAQLKVALPMNGFMLLLLPSTCNFTAAYVGRRDF